MRQINLTPEAQQALDELWSRNESFADRIEEGLDWIEADPPNIRTKRHGFASGHYGFEITYALETWIIIWAENRADPMHPTVYFIGESFL